MPTKTKTLKKFFLSVANWKCYLKVNTSISQSSKKFLQFTEASRKKSSNTTTTVVYGLGFPSESECKTALKTMEDAKDRLQTMKDKRKLPNQNEESINGAMNMTCPPKLNVAPLMAPENNHQPSELLQAHVKQENEKQLEAWQKENENLTNQNEALMNEMNEIKLEFKAENDKINEKMGSFSKKIE